MVAQIVVAQAAMSFASGFLNGLSDSSSAKSAVKQYQQEAAMYRSKAAQARLAGALAEDAARAQNRAALAEKSALLGEAGMGESPTTTTALTTTAVNLEQNVLNQRYQVESEAENYLYMARVADYNASAAKKKSKKRFQNAFMSGVNSVLGSSGELQSLMKNGGA